MLICTDEAGQVVRSDIITWTLGAPFGGLDAGRRAAEEARQRLPLPDPAPASSPPVGTPHVVGIPSWFWTTTAWAPVTASATLAGVTATVTATPTTLTVNPGDGAAPITCADGGTTYDPTRPAGDQHSACTHTYQRRSAGQPADAFAVTLTATWHITWAATTGETGDLGTLTRTTVTPVATVQAQALIR